MALCLVACPFCFIYVSDGVLLFRPGLTRIVWQSFLCFPRSWTNRCGPPHPVSYWVCLVILLPVCSKPGTMIIDRTLNSEMWNFWDPGYVQLNDFKLLSSQFPKQGTFTTDWQACWECSVLEFRVRLACPPLYLLWTQPCHSFGTVWEHPLTLLFSFGSPGLQQLEANSPHVSSMGASGFCCLHRFRLGFDNSCTGGRLLGKRNADFC
jgi:hypothetical protein